MRKILGWRGVAVTVLLLPALIAAPSNRAPAKAQAARPNGAHDPAQGGQDCVKSYEPTRVEALRSDGTTQPPQANDGLGRRYEFTQLGDAHEDVAPPGWRPAQASDHELRVYGFPPRPKEPTARQRWEAHAERWTGGGNGGTPRMCST